ncbi:MAG: hypothetical protein ACTSUU_04465, partial [Candidatus Thorarchaeota archaeon]
GLTVTFSEPVTITSFGDVLMTAEPTGESTTFTFSGGEVSPSSGEWLNWVPASARLVGHEWLTELYTSPVFAQEEATMVLHTRQDAFQLVLPEEAGGETVGVVKRTLSVEQIPFVATYEIESDLIESDVRWTSTHPETSETAQVVIGPSAHFLYLSNRNDPEVTARFEMDGEWYEWTDPDISFPLHNMTGVQLNAESLFPEESIASAEWSASNGDPDDATTFPIHSESATTATLVSQWPNALDVTCVATTASGEDVEKTTRALLYFQDGPPWEIRGTGLEFSAPMSIDTWVRVVDEMIPALKRMGINTVVPNIYWYFGYPDNLGNFSIEPIYHYGAPYSIDDDPRGSTQTEEVIEYVFKRFDEVGIDVIPELRVEAYHNEPEIEHLYSHAGYSTFGGFMQTREWLYGDGKGLYNYYTHYIPLFIRSGVDGVSLGAEQGQVENEGGEFSRTFFKAVAAEYRDQGFTGMLTHAFSYAVLSGLGLNAVVPDPEVYDPIACGVPWDELGTLSATFYPILAESPDDTTAQMQEEARRQIRDRLLSLHRVWGVPFFIAEMRAYACDGLATAPLDESCFKSGVYAPEELRRYMTALLRTLAEAQDWTEVRWIQGIAAGLFTQYPSWWPQGADGVSHQHMDSILNVLDPDLAYQDTIQVFYREAPLQRNAEHGSQVEVVHVYVPPTLAELGYVLPEECFSKPDLLIDTFEPDFLPSGQDGG